MTYEHLLACSRSGQMTPAQMLDHMRDDHAFAEYANRHLGRTV